MLKYFPRLVAFFVSRVLRFWSRARYARLRVGPRVILDVAGKFRYEQGCVIAEGANIIIPKHSELILGKGCYVGRYVELSPGKCIEIGNSTSIQDRSILVGDIRVGQYCMISLNVLISSGRHYYNLFPSWLIKDQDAYVVKHAELNSSHSWPVVIEDDCWLGINSVVMPGVKIGKGSVVGANSVVTHDVPPYTVVAGSPAKFIKKRLDFLPPRKIHYQTEADWPYFYSGFNSSRESLSFFNGMSTNRNEFTICLQCSSGDNLILSVKSIVELGCAVMHGKQRRVLIGDMQEIFFDVEEVSEGKVHFKIERNGSGNEVILLGARIENGTSAAHKMEDAYK